VAADLEGEEHTNTDEVICRMVVTIEGEFLDGFYIEAIPQYNTDDVVDMNALSSIAGMRAVWLLYFLDKWEHLEDLGVDRSEIEPVLKEFRYGRRLTARQAQQLQKKVPALVEASKELRLAYALKQLDRKKRRKRMDMTIYHAEISSAKLADEIAKRHRPEIEAARGSIEVAHGMGKGNSSIVMVKLPALPVVDPANILPGSGLRFSTVRAQVVPVPKPQGE
jgi:hypothetical protein